MTKTIEEINEKIRAGKAVVVNAEEVIGIAADLGYKKAAEKIDVVTTGTMGVMCSSGAFLNFWHTKPKIKMQHVWLDDVPAYGGLAAVDCYLGATEIPENDPANAHHPGHFRFGGGHVIEKLIAGKEVHLRATAYGTDCYPRREYEQTLTLQDLRQAFLFNPRNAYQNYNVATNCSDKTIYTYMGVLKPHMENIHYSSAGQLSPLLNDPYYRTIGLGSRIFLGGGLGYVAWPGTQHAPADPRNERGIPLGGAGTLAVIGDMKQMDARYIRGVSMTGYGVSLMVGIGVPIPIIDEDMLAFTAISDAEIQAPLCDYGCDGYPTGEPCTMGYVNYQQLKSGQVEWEGKTIRTAPMSSYSRALEIADILKEWILSGKFELSQPVQPLPGQEQMEQFAGFLGR
ncbi:MAG: homocysteine biosynthesis protein [Firmicutes bacterium]|nr:homocysteine biosynthesis protein [Bacillota bacterium]